MNIVTEKIKNLFWESGMSQSELAQKVGYKDRSSIAKIMNDECDVPRSKYAAFSKAFGVTVSHLLGNDESKNNVILVDGIHALHCTFCNKREGEVRHLLQFDNGYCI